jgi:uncharacterized protein YpiB (UPF0302 family)
MREYTFLDGSAGCVRFLACYLEVLKKEDPEKHEKICEKQREIMKNIVPDSGYGPSLLQLIKEVLQQADKKRFYEVSEMLNNGE